MTIVAETAFAPEVDWYLLTDGCVSTSQEFWERLRRSRPKPSSEKLYDKIENSTAQQEHPEQINLRINNLLQAAMEQDFEYGMESDFSRELVFLVKKYGNDALNVITDLVINESVNPEIAFEALRWLGRMHHPISYYQRLWLLEKCLYSTSRWIRDGAALGLASLDNPLAIDYLKDAIQRETYAELRQDMEQVLEQLEDTRRATSPAKD